LRYCETVGPTKEGCHEVHAIVAALVLIGWATPGPTTLVKQTQAELNQAAGKDLKDAEAEMTHEMTQLLDLLLKRADGNRGAIAKLTNAQTAWRVYRDAQVAARWPFPEKGRYGSVYPMCVASELTNLTNARIAELRRMLTSVEGEVCNSQWPD